MFSKSLVKLVFAVFALGVVVSGSGICADVQNPDAKRAEMMSKMSTLSAMHFSKEIGLSDKQQEDIKAIQKQSRESIQAFMVDSKSKRDDLGTASKSKDPAAMEKAKTKFEGVSKQMMDMRMAEVDKIAAVLSAEQKAKLTELVNADRLNAIEKMKTKTQEKPVIQKKK